VSSRKRLPAYFQMSFLEKAAIIFIFLSMKKKSVFKKNFY